MTTKENNQYLVAHIIKRLDEMMHYAENAFTLSNDSILNYDLDSIEKELNQICMKFSTALVNAELRFKSKQS